MDYLQTGWIFGYKMVDLDKAERQKWKDEINRLISIRMIIRKKRKRNAMKESIWCLKL